MIRIITTAVVFISIIFSKNYYLGDSLVQEGVVAFYNYEFDRSVVILEKARKDYPDHPGVHLIWVASKWVRSQAYDSTVETYKILEDDLSLIHPKYEELEGKYKYDPIYKLYQGSAMGLAARVSLGEKKWLKTLYRSYKGFSIIQEVANNSPEIIDAQLPIGIVEYFAGISNSLLRWAVNMYGLEASRKTGIDKIEIAADKGKWSWIEAKAILCNLYLWVEDDPLLALGHAKDLAEKFPGNYWFSLMYCESLIRNKDLLEAKKLLNVMDRMIIDLTIKQKKWYIPYQNYEMALLNFYSGDYIKTLKLVNKTIKDYNGELDIILGNAYLLEGMAHDKLFRRDKAKVSYKNCIELENFSNAIILSKKYLSQPYSIDP